MLIVLPLKTTPRIPIKASISDWINNSHPHFFSTTKSLSSDLQRLDSLRACLSDSLGPAYSGHAAAISDRALEDLTEYHACLVAAERQLSLPSSERLSAINGASDFLEFTWYNAFRDDDGSDDDDDDYDPHKEDDAHCKTTRANLSFERACVLWNLAALYSYFPTTSSYDCSWTTKEGRAAIKHCYATAATLLRYIRTVLLPRSESTSASSSSTDQLDLDEDDLFHIRAANASGSTRSIRIPPTPDLADETLLLCESLLLAQGQLCTYEAAKSRLHAPSTSSTNSAALYALSSKIAAGASDHYNAALALTQSSDVSSHLPRTSRAWGRHAKTLSMLYRARAEFLESVAGCRLQGKFGAEIARLKRAETMLDEALAFVQQANEETTDTLVEVAWDGARGLGTNGLAEVEALHRTVRQRRIVVEKENRELYHEDVPTGDGTKSLVPVVVGRDMMADVVGKGIDGKEDLKFWPVALNPDVLVRPIFASLRRI